MAKVENKALFIPLLDIWFQAFKAGTKKTEYRAYGPRWNERTCWIGRQAVLARGYGHPRLNRTVTRFDKLPRHLAQAVAQEIFPKAEFIAAIELNAL